MYTCIKYVCVCVARLRVLACVCVCVCVCFVVFFKKYTYTIIISKTSIRIIELPLSTHMITLMITLPMFETGQISGLNARSPFNQYYYIHRYIYNTFIYVDRSKFELYVVTNIVI